MKSTVHPPNASPSGRKTRSARQRCPLRFPAGTVFTVLLLFTMGMNAAAQAPKVPPKTSYSVNHYTFEGPGTVNTWWIETENSLIVIDVQRDLPHAREALAKVQAVGKPIAAILVTHGHPDHWAGLGIFREAFPQAGIYASRLTYETIRNDPNGYMPFMKEIPGNETFDHAKIPLPDRVFKNNETLTIGGVSIRTRELGPGESNGATAYYLPLTGELFAGDVIQYRMHGFYLEGHTLQWIELLKGLRTKFPEAKTIHPGHGASGPADVLIRDQLAYTQYFVGSLSGALKKNGNQPLNAPEKTRIVAQVREKFPTYGRSAGQPNVLELSVDGLEKELLKAGKNGAESKAVTTH